MDALVREDSGLDPRAVRELLEYLDEGWRILENPDRARRELEQQCRTTRARSEEPEVVEPDTYRP